MAKSDKILIMKFGGAAVKSAKNFSKIADLILRRNADYKKIAIVISAMGNMTDELISLAKEVNSDPPRREYDMLVSVGERVSIALLAMALAAKGRGAVSYTGSQTGIITTSDHSEATIIDVRPYRLLESLSQGKFVIVAGFQGMSENREITTLGRGGSDTTAVALGVALGADRVEFYKDVTGIFDQDPKQFTDSTLCSRLSFDEALKVIHASGGKVLHPRAIRLAQKNGLPLQIRSFHHADVEGSLVFSDKQTSNKELIYE
ncbi:MAG: Aspartokinase [Chlamydiae bacterium]|nr:Aspartokinase [Chlamydiota bacterium]